MTIKHRILSAALLILVPATARAQFSIDWFTIDGGGGTSSGGGFELTGTIGQHDASVVAGSGGSFECFGGFWGAAAGQSSCYPDCTNDGVLTVADFGCFQTKFVAGDPYADCNASGTLTVADFGCFQTRFVAGCP
jgi:hypothetical protein